MLFATSDSEAAKNPRLRLIARRSSAVSPLGDFHSAISACIEISVGIQWLLHPDRYRSHAHLYFSGSSWFTSARQLIIAFSSTRTRAPPRSIVPSPVGSEPAISAGVGCVNTSLANGSSGSVQSSTDIMAPREKFLLAGFAGRVSD